MAAALQSDATALIQPEAAANPPGATADRPRFGGFCRTFAALVALVGTIVAALWLLEGGTAFKTAERAFEGRLAVEAGARAEAMTFALREVRAAAGPLMKSDLVRVVAALLAAETSDGGERAVWLRAQVPFVRSSLAGFMHAQGLDGVALLSSHGRPLLSVGPAPPPPASDAWRRGPAFGAVRRAAADDLGGERDLRVDAYLALPPARPVAEEGVAEPVAVLALTLPLADRFGDRLAPPPGSGIRVWLTQPGPDGEQRVLLDGRPEVVAAAPTPVHDPLWSLVGELTTPVVATAPIQRAPFRVVSTAPVDILLSQARRRAQVTLPLALALTLGLALLLAWWHHRHPAAPAQRVDHYRAAVPPRREVASPGPRDEPSAIEQFGALIPALPAPAALVDDEGRVAAASPAFEALAAGGEVVGRPLAAALADPAGAAWRELLENAQSAAEARAVGHGRDRMPVGLVARRIGPSPGVTLLMAEPGSPGGAEGRRPQAQAEAMVAVLVRAVEFRDPFLLGHTERLRRLAGEVAERLGLPDADRQTLDLAAQLSQIGKIFVPDAILTKHARHDAAEAKVMQAHIEHAVRILEPLDLGLPVAETLAQMHERLDGTGYPRGLGGDAIGLPARILGVVDVYCARTAARSYRDRVSPGQALYHLAQRPDRYDSQVVAALASLAAKAEQSTLRALPRTAEPSPEGDAAA